MLDNLKIITYEQKIIQRLATIQGFAPYQHRNNNYSGFCKYGNLLKLDFRKVFEAGELAGFHHVAISLSPHYHFNNYLHNGNDLTPENCVKMISDILTFLKIEPTEYDLLKVVNIEFGLNIILETDVKNLINGLYFYKKTPFKVGDFPYFKITDATKYKNIKAYAKGLQFESYPQYGININTFRFEVKSKKGANIQKYGINTASDLMKIETYHRLGQELLDEWEQVLLTNQTPDLSNLKTDEIKFIQNANKRDFWGDLYRVKFARSKEKYHKILKGKNDLHTQIKGQIIDKLFSFQGVTFFPQKTPINPTKDQNAKDHQKEIKGQNVTLSQNIKQCLVTGIDISMQKKESKFLCSTGLKWYKENEPATYKEIEKKYLTEKMRTRPLKDQIYFIAHNIRNTTTNPRHNPKYSRQRFEQRNYHKQQLQFNF